MAVVKTDVMEFLSRNGILSRHLAFVVVLLSTLGMSAAPYAGVLPKDGAARYELAFWETIKDSERAEDYEAYLEAFPNGRFAPLAKTRAAYFRKSKETATATARVKIDAMDVHYDVIETANVRKEPTARSTRIATLQKGTRVLVTGRVVDKNWYRIETGNGTTGYIFGKLIQAPSPPSDLAKKPAQVTRKKDKQIAKFTPVPKPPAPSPAVDLSKITQFSDCSFCPEMVSLPAGAFLMGDKRGDRTEQPLHRVSIRKPFAIGKYEVTVKEWNACVADGGCRYKPEKAGNAEEYPVRDVSWIDTQEYLRWLQKKTGQPYRLPTEAEWEYAARAGTKTKYWWGERFIQGKVNCKDCGGDWDRKSPTSVGSFEPNPFGLYDINGSVWEWVSDCWNESYVGAPSDGSPWDKQDCREHVIRGGSWRNDQSYMHSASRFRYDADVRYLVNGFRVAKDLQ